MTFSKNEIIFEEDQVVFFNDKTSFKNVIETLSENLIKKDLVKPEYPKEVILREKKFPTGLPTRPFGVSIPHTDAKWTNHNAISIGVLKHPIKQVIMGSNDTEVDIDIVFMLALDQSNKQLNILSKLMTVFQNSDNLYTIKNGSKEQIKEIVKKAILEE